MSPRDHTPGLPDARLSRGFPVWRKQVMEQDMDERMKTVSVLFGVSFAMLLALFVYVFRIRSDAYWLFAGLRDHPIGASLGILLLDAWVAFLALTGGQIARWLARARSSPAPGGSDTSPAAVPVAAPRGPEASREARRATARAAR